MSCRVTGDICSLAAATNALRRVRWQRSETKAYWETEVLVVTGRLQGQSSKQSHTTENFILITFCRAAFYKATATTLHENANFTRGAASLNRITAPHTSARPLSPEPPHTGSRPRWPPASPQHPPFQGSPCRPLEKIILVLPFVFLPQTYSPLSEARWPFGPEWTYFHVLGNPNSKLLPHCSLYPTQCT